jgi:hypothetical protein
VLLLQGHQEIQNPTLQHAPSLLLLLLLVLQQSW